MKRALWFITFLICLFTITLFSKPTKFAIKRHQMIEEQLIKRNIKDNRVLDVMRKVPRHEFVPLLMRPLSYSDRPLSIGNGQTISQPYIVAYMTEAAMLKPSDRVLEIGTGSGYQAAVLAEICKSVYSIEILKNLGEKAKKLLVKLGYKNISFRIGDGYQGWPEKAPFDAILVTAAPNHIPKPLLNQLKIGGRMILPVGDRAQELIRITKTKTGTKKETLFPVRFVPMTGEAEKIKGP